MFNNRIEIHLKMDAFTLYLHGSGYIWKWVLMASHPYPTQEQVMELMSKQTTTPSEKLTYQL